MPGCMWNDCRERFWITLGLRPWFSEQHLNTATHRSSVCPAVCGSQARPQEEKRVTGQICEAVNSPKAPTGLEKEEYNNLENQQFFRISHFMVILWSTQLQSWPSSLCTLCFLLTGQVLYQKDFYIWCIKLTEMLGCLFHNILSLSVLILCGATEESLSLNILVLLYLYRLYILKRKVYFRSLLLKNHFVEDLLTLYIKWFLVTFSSPLSYFIFFPNTYYHLTQVFTFFSSSHWNRAPWSFYCLVYCYTQGV